MLQVSPLYHCPEHERAAKARDRIQARAARMSILAREARDRLSRLAAELSDLAEELDRQINEIDRVRRFE